MHSRISHTTHAAHNKINFYDLKFVKYTPIWIYYQLEISKTVLLHEWRRLWPSKSYNRKTKYIIFALTPFYHFQKKSMVYSRLNEFVLIFFFRREIVCVMCTTRYRMLISVIDTRWGYKYMQKQFSIFFLYFTKIGECENKQHLFKLNSVLTIDQWTWIGADMLIRWM